MTKPFHAGHAAENGTVAADLAALGWTAAEDILEAPLGFFQAGGGFDPHLIVERLGNPWMFASPGDLIKRFPCGTIQQPVMDEMLRLIQKNNIKAADVERVEVGGNQSNCEHALPPSPYDRPGGKIQHGIHREILLLEGKAALSQFTDAVVQRPEVQDMIGRVRFYVDPEFDKPELREASLQAMLVEQEHPKNSHERWQIISGLTRARQGQPGKSHDLRRSGRQIQRQRRFRQMAEAKSRVGH